MVTSIIQKVSGENNTSFKESELSKREYRICGKT